MMDERTPEEEALRAAVDALVRNLPRGPGGTSFTPGDFRPGYGDDEGGPFDRFELKSQHKQWNTRGDGVNDVYEITVTVTRRRDSDDGYWNAQIRDRARALVINGKHYRIGRGGTPFRGFGGRKFEIEYLADGRRVTVDDLWYQGPIPPAFRTLPEFHDNARFVNPEQEPFR